MYNLPIQEKISKKSLKKKTILEPIFSAIEIELFTANRLEDLSIKHRSFYRPNLIITVHE